MENVCNGPTASLGWEDIDSLVLPGAAISVSGDVLVFSTSLVVSRQGIAGLYLDRVTEKMRQTPDPYTVKQVKSPDSCDG